MSLTASPTSIWQISAYRAFACWSGVRGWEPKCRVGPNIPSSQNSWQSALFLGIKSG